MSLEHNIDDPLIGDAGFIFQTPIRAKRTKAPKDLSALSPAAAARRAKAAKRRALAAIRATVSRVPEVMVKVSGSAHGRKNLAEHLSYITRNGQLRAEVADVATEDSYLVSGSRDVRQIAGEWFARSGANRRSNARQTINLVLSMPAGVDRDAHARAVEAFARAAFAGRFDYMLVHHTDTAHPHAHLTVRTRNDQGQYLNPRKDDLQAWREAFAQALRRQGVQALATPRRARGVVQKATRQAIRHMDGRRGATTTRWKIQQAVKTLGGTTSPEPWRQPMHERQRKIRHAWNTLATALEGQGEHVLARQVREFVQTMPSLRTRHDQLLEDIRGNPELLAKSQRALKPVIEQEPSPRRRG